MSDERPIGLIDSGIGGFTVLRELQKRLPNENIVYLGDSLRMPYGELDNDTIVAYADSDIRFLEARQVKAVLLACNTVSSVIERLSAGVPLFSIVEAGCLATLEAVGTETVSEVGLIATRATVQNAVYPQTLAAMTDRVRFVQHGTQTLASVINNYPNEIELLRRHIRMAVDPLIAENRIDQLLLGCTHYPIVRESIEQLYPGLSIINPAVRQVEILSDYLRERGMTGSGQSTTTIYTTGSQADYKIFESMIDYLGIRCDRLCQGALDIDNPRQHIGG